MLVHIDLKLVPEFILTHVQHLMPNHAMKSQGLPFSTNTTANLAEGEGTDEHRGNWEKGQSEIVTLHLQNKSFSYLQHILYTI